MSGGGGGGGYRGGGTVDNGGGGGSGSVSGSTGNRGIDPSSESHRRGGSHNSNVGNYQTGRAKVRLERGYNAGAGSNSNRSAGSADRRDDDTEQISD